MYQCHDYDCKVQGLEHQAGDLVWIHNVIMGETSARNYCALGSGPRLSRRESTGGDSNRKEKPLSFVHLDQLEV